MDSTQTDTTLSESHFLKLRSIIHDNTGITISDNRKSMLLSRLRPRLREVNEPSFKAYIARVSTDADEMQELINRVTTNKTYFYRTPRIWDYFRAETVPAFLETKSSKPMQVWSAAASSGEEAHTIGVVLSDVQQKNPGFNFSVLGTDVSSRVLKLAEEGVYRAPAVSQFKRDQPELYHKHIRGNEKKGFTVDDDVKAKLKFKRHNLLEKLKSSTRFDAVFLRNVLIYFTAEDQEKILLNVSRSMDANACLIIGESETLTQLNTPFEMVAPMIYKLKSAVGD